MNLFLDIISPLPEFVVIDYNKIILSKKILETKGDILSDNIISCYQNLNKKLNLDKNLKNIIVTIGPGSYTSLRVGIAFVRGIQLSKNIKIACISIEDQYNYLSLKTKDSKFGIYIISANQQKFFCYKFKNKFIHLKIDSNNFKIPNNIKKMYCNEKCKEVFMQNLIIKTFDLKKDLIEYLYKINFSKNMIIKPIYISNNKILN